MNKLSFLGFVLVACMGLSKFSFSSEMNSEATGFDQFPKVYGDVKDELFTIRVYDKHLFLGNRNESTVNDENIETKKIGDIVLLPKLHVYIEEGGIFELFLTIKSATDDHVLLDNLGGWGNVSLLFNGQGTLYVKSRPRRFCDGTGNEVETRKYQFENGVLKEVQQPLILWENVTTQTTTDVILFSDHGFTSPSVAKLTKGTKVQVLTEASYNKMLWYLIKTPFGLTGWVPESPQVFSFDFGCG